MIQKTAVVCYFTQNDDSLLSGRFHLSIDQMGIFRIEYLKTITSRKSEYQKMIKIPRIS